MTPYPALVATVWAESWADLVSAAWEQVRAESVVASGSTSGAHMPAGWRMYYVRDEPGLFERLAREIREDQEARGDRP